MTGGAGRLGPRALAAVGLALLAACGGPAVDRSRPLADGVYQADSGPDEEGAVGHIVVTVADGRVSDCQFSVVMADGRVKGADYGLDSTGQIANADYYAQAQRAVAALTVYARQLIEVGYPQDVDVVAGATWAHDQFVEAATTALEASQEAL
jgi:major membrane immunogen (membrane-anchored lipoprotein)